MKKHSWTDKDGIANTSDAYHALVEHVDRLIRDSAFALINGHSKTVASLIVSQLAHKHGLSPVNTDKKQETEEALLCLRNLLSDARHNRRVDISDIPESEWNGYIEGIQASIGRLEMQKGA